MEETLSQLQKIVSFDEESQTNLLALFDAIENDKAIMQPLSVFTSGKSKREFRLTYFDSTFSDGIPEVRVVSRSEDSDSDAELIAQFFRIDGKRKAKVIKHHN